MKDISPLLRVHLWFETEKGQVMGLGRVQLLEAVDRLGSLNRAAKAMGMSYRAAWGRIKQSEEILGEALVETAEGHKGFQLTARGRELAAAFRRFFATVEGFALTAARKEFPWSVTAYPEEPERP